jgi:hypothetical protein
MATTRSVGCVAALLPRIRLKAVAKWFRKEEQAVVKSKAESSAKNAPFVIETDITLSNLLDSRSNAASGSAKSLSFCSEICSSAEGQNIEEVKTSTRTNDETWAEMRRRFQNAHRNEQAAGSRASIDGGVSAPVQQKAREPKRARSAQATFMWGPPPWQM